MVYEYKLLGDLLSDPRIRPVAQDAIRRRDLKREPVWNMTLAQLQEEHVFSGGVEKGLRRLFEAAEAGDWYFPLYTEAECAADEARRGVSLVRLPSDEPEADGRPFILLVPGGGFVNVWNLTEGWPIAEEFNRLGYHVFVLTYQVDGQESLLDRNMEDFARALRLIRGREAQFRVRGDRYMTCGFSAGGYLVCLWNTGKGYRAFGLARPQACFPVYPVVSLQARIRYGSKDTAEAVRLFGCPVEEAAKTDYEIPDHAEGFPPCALFAAAEDTLVDPENSRLLARSLKALGIPCRLEIGPEGGHGFGTGEGMCMAGWTERAVRWAEAAEKEQKGGTKE